MSLSLSFILLFFSILSILSILSDFLFETLEFILTNVLSALFLINFNLYIIFCGKEENIDIKNYGETSIIKEISNFMQIL